MTLHKLIIFAFLLYSFNVVGQTEKGKFQIGVGIMPYISSSDNNFTLTLHSNVGYFVSNNWCVGISAFSFRIPALENPSSQSLLVENYSSTMNFWGLNLYSRYYLGKEKFKFYGEIGAGLGGSNLKLVYSQPSTDFRPFNANVKNASLGFGVVYNFNKPLSIEANFPFVFYQSSYVIPNILSYSRVDKSFSPTIGGTFSF